MMGMIGRMLIRWTSLGAGTTRSKETEDWLGGELNIVVSPSQQGSRDAAFSLIQPGEGSPERPVSAYAVFNFAELLNFDVAAGVL